MKPIAYSGPRKGQPSLSALAEFWREREHEVPGARISIIGLGEPMCFRCGWLAPVPDTNAFLGLPSAGPFRPRQEHPEWTVERALRETWRAAEKFLDRAHLADYCVSGDNSASNILPLCHFPCHRSMPEFDERGDALAWVAEGTPAPHWWQFATDTAAERGILMNRRGLERLRLAVLEAMSRRVPDGADPPSGVSAEGYAAGVNT
jgi:hypothetical protein